MAPSYQRVEGIGSGLGYSTLRGPRLILLDIEAATESLGSLSVAVLANEQGGITGISRVFGAILSQSKGGFSLLFDLGPDGESRTGLGFPVIAIWTSPGASVFVNQKIQKMIIKNA